jgi:hypothetical protein
VTTLSLHETILNLALINNDQFDFRHVSQQPQQQPQQETQEEKPRIIIAHATVLPSVSG